MRPLIIFLNELSCTFSVLDSQVVRERMLVTLNAIMAVKRIRRDLLIGSHIPLSKVSFGDGSQSFANILSGNDYREEWRFLQNLQNYSPWDAYPGAKQPSPIEEVYFLEQRAHGMTLAFKNETATFSFSFIEHWSDERIGAQHCSLSDEGDIICSNITIRNISNQKHVDYWQDPLRDYGHDVSYSSLIYSDSGFVIRMFLDDHDPPHIHLLENSNSSCTMAKIAIKTLDCIKGQIQPNLERKVKELVKNNRDTLMENWNRCRNGVMPISIS